MGILFAISVLALAALLWASLSIARHIRNERQRHAGAGFAGPVAAGPSASSSDPALRSHELSFSELTPYGPTVVSRTLLEPAPPPPIPEPIAEPAAESISGPESPAAMEAALAQHEAHTEAEAHAAIKAQAEAEGTPTLEAQAEPDPSAQPLAPPDATALAGPSEPPLSITISAEQPSAPRAIPTLLPIVPRPPAAPPAPPLKNRLDWAYFNKDMGDLSDPLPSHPRLRHRPH